MQKPQQILLGSQSPRRLEILQQAGFEVQVFSTDIEEIFPDDLDIHRVPEYLSNLKLSAVSAVLKDAQEMIICADTVVIFDNKLIGKPINTNQSFDILKAMNGKPHEVITGVSMQYQNKRISFSEKATVFFKILSDEEIWHYIHHFNTLDKAGAYNIQEFGGVEKLEGEFFNVMGLPIKRVLAEIEVW